MEDRKTVRKDQINPDDISVVKGFPFFQNMDEKQLQKFLEGAVVLRYEAAQTIIRRGEVANAFFIILNGRINVGVLSDHKFVPVQTLKTGNVLGWSWLIPPHQWRFDAMALERTRILLLDGTRIRNMCEQDHDLGFEVMKRVATVLAGRLELTRHDLIDPKKSIRTH